MCTYATLNTELDGSAKGPDSKWFHVSHGTSTSITLSRDGGAHA